jgi:hypothetical protein
VNVSSRRSFSPAAISLRRIAAHLGARAERGGPAQAARGARVQARRLVKHRQPPPPPATTRRRHRWRRGKFSRARASPACAGAPFLPHAAVAARGDARRTNRGPSRPRARLAESAAVSPPPVIGDGGGGGDKATRAGPTAGPSGPALYYSFLSLPKHFFQSSLVWAAAAECVCRHVSQSAAPLHRPRHDCGVRAGRARLSRGPSHRPSQE